MSTDGRFELLTKKEVIKLERERKHLSTNLSGINEHETPSRRDLRDRFEQRGRSLSPRLASWASRSSLLSIRTAIPRLWTTLSPATTMLSAPSASSPRRSLIRPFEGVQMVSERAFAEEVADVQQAEVASEFVGEDGELNEVQASITAADADEDENVDLAAVLGGNIRKAPAAASVDEPDAAIADAGA